MDRRLLVLLLVLFGLSVVFWDSWAFYPLKLLVVTLHETGHALATLIVGGQVDTVTVDRFQGGATLGRVPMGFLPAVVVASAGYVGSSLFGASILATSARARSGRGVLTALALLFGLVLAFWVRDPFTMLLLLVLIAGLLLAARLLPAQASRVVALFLGVFAAAYALWDIADDLFRARPGLNDAAILARATHVPALVWAVVWGALAVLVIRGGLRRAL